MSTFVTPVFFRLLGKLAERGEKPWSRLSAARVAVFLRPMTPADAAREADRLAVELAQPHLGLTVALALAPGDFELLEFLAVSGPSWLASMERVVRYAALLNPALVVELHATRKAVDIVERVVAQPEAMGRHINEFSIITYVRVMHSALGPEVSLIEATLAHADGRSGPVLQPHLRGCRLIFGAGENRLRLSRADAERPLSKSNTALFGFLDAMAQKALAAAPPPSISAITEQLVARGLIEGRGRIDDVAACLHLSRRTLQRRLLVEGTTFEAVVDALRRRLAVGVLSQDISLSEGSSLLGYSDPRAFRRALRRWGLNQP